MSWILPSQGAHRWPSVSLRSPEEEDGAADTPATRLHPRTSPLPAPHGEISEAVPGETAHIESLVCTVNSSLSRFSCFRQYSPQIRCWNSECLAREQSATAESYVQDLSGKELQKATLKLLQTSIPLPRPRGRASPLHKQKPKGKVQLFHGDLATVLTKLRVNSQKAFEPRGGGCGRGRGGLAG